MPCDGVFVCTSYNTNTKLNQFEPNMLPRPQQDVSGNDLPNHDRGFKAR